MCTHRYFENEREATTSFMTVCTYNKHITHGNLAIQQPHAWQVYSISGYFITMGNRYTRTNLCKESKVLFILLSGMVLKPTSTTTEAHRLQHCSKFNRLLDATHAADPLPIPCRRHTQPLAAPPSTSRRLASPKICEL